MGFWNQFEGQLLDGQFKLSKYSGTDGDCAVFLSDLAGQELFVVVNIIRSASLPAQRLSSSWKIAKDLQHPNLIRAYGTATADLDGLRVLYAVLDCPDASLAGVIQERCLTEDEGRELLVSCAEALHYLHQKGIVHTRVRPGNILAVDVATKLSINSLSRAAGKTTVPPQLDRYDAPQVQKAGYSPASDIWALGSTVFEALTQTLPTGNTDPQMRSLPGPFPEVLRHCLDPNPASRWSARQILAFLQSGASALAPIAPKPQPLPSAGPALESKPHSAPSPATRHELSMPNLLTRCGLLIRRFVPLRYIISAVIILLCLGWLGKTSQTYKPDTGTADATGSAVSSPVAPPPLIPTASIRPSPISASTHVKNSAAGTADRARSVWRVVVFTYSTGQDAHAKMRDINSKSPRLNARVLSPTGEPSHMVVVGGPMSRVEASNLRKRLLAEGFPKDIYIQNFPE